MNQLNREHSEHVWVKKHIFLFYLKSTLVKQEIIIITDCKLLETWISLLAPLLICFVVPTKIST